MLFKNKDMKYHYIDHIVAMHEKKENKVICSYLCLKKIQLQLSMFEYYYPNDIIYYIMILLFNNILNYPCDDIICKYYWYIEFIQCNYIIEEFYHCGICHKTDHYDYMRYEKCDKCNINACTKEGKCIKFNVPYSEEDLEDPCLCDDDLPTHTLCVRCYGQILIRKGHHKQWVTFDESLINDYRRYKPSLN